MLGRTIEHRVGPYIIRHDGQLTSAYEIWSDDRPINAPWAWADSGIGAHMLCLAADLADAIIKKDETREATARQAIVDFANSLP